MNTAIKSHWRLAWKTFVKAVKVTFQITAASIRARYYSIKISEQLNEERRKLEAAEQEVLMGEGCWVMVDGKIKKEF